MAIITAALAYSREHERSTRGVLLFMPWNRPTPATGGAALCAVNLNKQFPAKTTFAENDSMAIITAALA